MSKRAQHAVHVLEEEPFRLRQIFAEDLKKAHQEAAHGGRSASKRAQDEAGEVRAMTHGELCVSGSDADIGHFVIEQLPAGARRDIKEYETSIKYWLDRGWIAAAVRKSAGIEPRWPHDPLRFFKPGGGGNALPRQRKTGQG
jgi:hypothetical protein